MKRCTECNTPLTATSTGITRYYNRKRCKKHDIRKERETVSYPIVITISIEEKHHWFDVRRLVMLQLFKITKNKSHVADILKIDNRTVRHNLKAFKHE